MTMPDERYRAVVYTEQFLMELLDPRKTPRVPKDIRQRARSLLRHYPSQWDMDRAATKSPEVFETRNEIDALSELIYDYEGKKHGSK